MQRTSRSYANLARCIMRADVFRGGGEGGRGQQRNPSRHDSYEWQVQIRGRPPSHVRGMSTSGGNLISNLGSRGEVLREMDGTDRRTEWSRGPADWRGECRKGRCHPAPMFGFDSISWGLKGLAGSLKALPHSHFNTVWPLYEWNFRKNRNVANVIFILQEYSECMEKWRYSSNHSYPRH